MRRSLFAAGLAALLITSTATAATIPNQYIVTLRKPLDGSSLSNTPVATQAQSLLAAVGGGRLLHSYEYALRGFSVRMGPAQAALLALNPLVASVDPDVEMHAVATQSNPPSYGIDRVDQRDLPLSGSYNYGDTAGQGAHVYVIDTGLNSNHSDFTGRVGTSRNFVAPTVFGSTDSNDWVDCNGHGTHVAGSAAGTAYGLAKKATIHAVRVLGCQGTGSGSDILAGIDWVAANAEQPAVANLSLGTLLGRSTAQETAVRNLVNANVAVAVAAGNDSKSACDTSPAAEPTVLTVGATERSDAMADYSNYGSCLDLFAPGTDIVSASYSNNTGSATMSGTSMASPHVAGALAIKRAQNASVSGADTQLAVMADTTPNKVTSIGAGSPNKLLYVPVTSGGSTPTPVDNPPVAAFSSSCTDLVCSFNGSGSSDDKGIASYAWSFGDGGSGNGSSVSRTYAAAGSYTVTLTVTDTTSQTNAKSQSVSVTAPSSSSPCADCATKTGSLTNGGTVYDPSSSGFTSSAGQFKGYLRGPAGTDFDLFLEKKNNSLLLSTWSIVARGETTTSSEDVTYNGTAGTYRWRIKSESGAGSYSFYVKNP